MGWRRWLAGDSRADEGRAGDGPDAPEQAGDEPGEPTDDALAGAAVGTASDPQQPAPAAEDLVEEPPDQLSATATREVEALVATESAGGDDVDDQALRPGPPLDRRSPFYIGLFGFLGVATAYALVLMLEQLTNLATYVVVALFIALGLEPIVARLVGGGWRRGQAVIATFLGLLVVCGLLGWLIVPVIVDQVTLLVHRTPGYLQDIQNSHWFQQLNSRFHVTDRVLSEVKDNIDQGTVTSVFGGVLGAGKAFADGVLAVFTVAVLTVYFTVAMPRVKAAAYKLVPQSRRPRFVHLSEEISRGVGRYILGQICVALVNGVLAYVILIVLDLPFPLVLATVIGLLALIPIVGTLVGAVLLTGVALASSWVDAVIMLAYYVAYHLLETYVISPRIMSRAVEVPPVITIVAVLAGGALLGILGALIAIPVAAGLLLLYNQVLVPRQQRN